MRRYCTSLIVFAAIAGSTAGSAYYTWSRLDRTEAHLEEANRRNTELHQASINHRARLAADLTKIQASIDLNATNAERAVIAAEKAASGSITDTVSTTRPRPPDAEAPAHDAARPPP